MNDCPRCGLIGGAWVTHVCGPGMPAVAPLRRTVSIDADLWTRMVLAAQSSDDPTLRTLVEQAAQGAHAN